MDPNENLMQLLNMASGVIAAEERDEKVSHELALRMAEHFLALDQWLKNGGFLPRRWQVKSTTPS
jgi:hypothetical protein